VQGGIIINTSEADTRVMVDDGQTAVIGGLIRSNISTVNTGVPVLKDIPIIKYLFSSNSEVKQNRELLIFVTPRLVATLASN
jgi:type IV pilus assembly protein PilQ